MPDLGKAYVQIVPSAQGIKSQIEEVLGKPIENSAPATGQKLGSGLMSGVKKVFAAAAVGKVLKDAFSAGGDLQQSFGGLETIYGDAAAGAKAFARRAAQAGISANDYAEQAVSFGAALKQAYGGDSVAAVKAANTAILDMADNAAKMGTPIESIQAAYQSFARGQYTLLDNLKLGYSGTKSEMERLLADAQALTGVEYNIDNVGDVYNAIHAIQGELGLTGVAAQEASTTLSGSFAAVKASWENVLGALMTGKGLGMAMDNLITSFGAFADNIIAMLQNLAPQLPTLILGLADAIISEGPAFLEAAVQLIGQLAVGLAQALPEIIGSIPELFGEVVSAILSVDWLGVGSDIINGIIEGLKAAASNLWESVKSIARDALAQLKSELGIGSPSKVFADQVGQWIPAGVALGIDDNLESVDSALVGMAGDMASQMSGYTAPGNTQPRAAVAAPVSNPDTAGRSQSNRPIILYMNGREVARGIWEDLNYMNDAHGVSLIMA